MTPPPDQARTRPRCADFHLFGPGDAPLLLAVEHGHAFEVPPLWADGLRTALDAGDGERVAGMAEMLGVPRGRPRSLQVPEAVSARAYSLAISQKCNLACTYCYAQQGDFGGQPTVMPVTVAEAAVERLLADAPRDGRITLAYMGGEPLANREVLHATTRYAQDRADALGLSIGFSLTTNGTLVRSEDIELFRSHDFSITVSLDGPPEHNRLRMFKSGRPSFEVVRRGLELLLSAPDRRYRVSARATVTMENLDLGRSLTALLDLGFDSIRFSPVLSSPAGGALTSAAFDRLLESMVECGELFFDGLQRGQLIQLENVLATLRRIHHYRREAYPCGAGGGYLGVSAEGDLFACHRFVNEEPGRLGDVASGVDRARQATWLRERHLGAQSPCGECWARYLCSGSCHHEVIHSGRPACDYIRGWVHYCLGLHARICEEPRLLAMVTAAFARA